MECKTKAFRVCDGSSPDASPFRSSQTGQNSRLLTRILELAERAVGFARRVRLPWMSIGICR